MKVSTKKGGPCPLFQLFKGGGGGGGGGGGVTHLFQNF